MPPFSQDVLTRIVNVQGVGGLAVEFGDEDEDAPGVAPSERQIERDEIHT